MKRLNLIWCVSVCVCLLFFSCSSDDEGGQGRNPIEEGYFSVENASFVDKAQPDGDRAVISELQVNSSAITGGSSIVSFTSLAELQSVYIGVEGVRGYYEYDLSNVLKSVQRVQEDAYTYEIVLLMSQQIKVDEFSLHLSVLTKSGEVSKMISSGDIDVIEVGTGSLQVSLAWDQFDDLDLHLFDPDGNHIYYGNPYLGDEITDEEDFLFECYLVSKYTNFDASKLNYQNEEDWDILYDYLDEIYDRIDYDNEYYSYFKDKIEVVLDLDSNAACYIDGVNNENITYANAPKEGEYTIAVDLFEKCDRSKAGAKYSVTVNYNGKPVYVSDKQIGQFADNDNGSWDTPDKYVIIGTFKIGEGGLRSAPKVKALHPGRERIRELVFRKK
ncbi:MAG: hypothetical protein LUG18_06800 [Candidatus Azobacteroides sp.]|nr:hypothetical protein [Candidatus Azobacteroides sp.]